MITSNKNQTPMTSWIIILLQFFTKNFLRAFCDAKSLRTTSRSIFSRTSLSMQYIAKPFNLSCNIVDLKQFFNIFNLEKLLSAEATITGTAKRI